MGPKLCLTVELLQGRKEKGRRLFSFYGYSFGGGWVGLFSPLVIVTIPVLFGMMGLCGPSVVFMEGDTGAGANGD